MPGQLCTWQHLGKINQIMCASKYEQPIMYYLGTRLSYSLPLHTFAVAADSASQFICLAEPQYVLIAEGIKGFCW